MIATPTEDMSDELADRLRRLADNQTTGSLPWPGVEETIHRVHRRRLALAAAGVVVALAAGVGTASLVLNPGQTRDLHTASQSAAAKSDPPKAFRDAGFVSDIGGSLADDTGFISKLRVRAALIAGDHDGAPITAADILVFWAGDIGGRRLAVVGYPAENGDLTLTTLFGEPGTSPAGMRVYDELGLGTLDRGSLYLPISNVIVGPGKDPTSGLVLVVAPAATNVEVADGRRFFPNGRITTEWRSLDQQGGVVWVGSLDADAMLLSKVRVDGEEREASSSLVPAPDTQPFLDVAVPGVDPEALDQARSAMAPAGVTSAEVPALAASSSVGPNPLTAAVMRSPDNGYIVGVNINVKPTKAQPTSSISAYAISDHPSTDAPSFMAAIDMGIVAEMGDTRVIAVVAPEQAATVRIGSITAPVTDRLALVQLPATDADGGSDESPVRVETLDAAGAAITAVTSEPMLNPVYGTD